MVTKDLTAYVSLLRSWELDAGFEPSFEVLTEIGNLFVIGPEALRERVKGLALGAGRGGMWDRGDVRAYVVRREDVGTVGVQSVLNAL